MSQTDYGVCPQIKRTMLYYETSGSASFARLYAIARRALKKDYEYLCDNFVWKDSAGDGLIKVKTVEDAKKVIDEYIHWCQYPESNFTFTVKGAPVSTPSVSPVIITPLAIDKERRRMIVHCPICDRKHISEIRTAMWSETTEKVTRSCPKKPDTPSYTVRLWTDNRDKLTAPVMAIEKLPKYECKECFASGVYIGFTSVEACSTCFPPIKAG